MKKAILAVIVVAVLVACGLSYRQYLSYQECKTQSFQAALFVFPNDSAHPEYAAKRVAMEANFIKTTCHKFGPNLGT
jgi:hypothetical protein